MKIATLSIAALLVAGTLSMPISASAQVATHGVAHSQQRQNHQFRHSAGVTRQQDKQLHRQERRGHRSTHNAGAFNNNLWNNGSNWGGANPIWNNGSNWGGSNLINPGSSWGFPATTAPYFGGAGIYGNAQLQPGATADGHIYTPDGHRLDHHGNHDDGPGDR